MAPNRRILKLSRNDQKHNGLFPIFQTRHRKLRERVCQFWFCWQHYLEDSKWKNVSVSNNAIEFISYLNVDYFLCILLMKIK